MLQLAREMANCEFLDELQRQLKAGKMKVFYAKEDKILRI